MKNFIDRYTYRVIWSEDDEEFVGLCAEFPYLSWLEPTREAALAGITKVVEESIEFMKEDGDPIPEPLQLHKYSGKFMVRVPPDVHRTLALEAAEQGVSLNRLVSSRLAPSSGKPTPKRKTA